MPTYQVDRSRHSGQKTLLSVAISLGLAALSPVALAQVTDSSVRGSVVGANANTTVQVVDSARGTTRTESVNDNGGFRVDGLAPGTYVVRVLQDGRVVDTQEVSVTIGSSRTITMGVSSSQINEIVTSGRRVSRLDTAIAESGLVINSAEIMELPISRDITSVALLAPGANAGDNRFGNLASFGGASVAENTTFINGLNTTNFRTGVGFSSVPFEFYDTIQVKTGGYSAKYGRSLGGVMNATTKSGTNEWKAGANFYYNEDLDTSPNTYAAANDLDMNEDTNGEIYLSGPIIKDKLFFYALYNDVKEESRYAGIETGRDYDSVIDEGFYGYKIDGYITPNHHLEYTAFSDTSTEVETVYGFDGDTFTRGALVGDTLYETGGDNWIASYTGNFGDDLQISVSYGENEANRTTAPASADIPVVYEYLGGFQTRGEWSNFTVSKGDDLREMTRADIQWTGFQGHEISFGIDNEDAFANEATINSGGVYWLLDPTNAYNGCTPTECPQGANVRKRTYSVGGSFETNSEAFYLQDVWDVTDQLTLELGIRNESFRNKNASGGIFVEVEDQWAPRLSAVYDLTGDGSSKVFGSYGEYYLPIAANTNIRMSGNETYIHEYFDWDGVSVDSQYQPTGIGATPYDTVVYGDGSVPDTRSTTDANLDAMYQEEYILGYQTTLDSGVTLGVKGIYRSLGTTIEDVAIDAAVINYYNANNSWTGSGTVEDTFTGFHQYVLTNPGNPMSIYIPETSEQITLSPSQLGYPEAERDYKALEFTLSRPFDGRWSADVSYIWSKSEGNHEGYVKSDNAQDDAGITQNFDQPGLVDNSYGLLPNDRAHTLKAWGVYQFDNGLRIGANLLAQSGRPISCFGVHPSDAFAADYGASSHFCQGNAVGRGSLGRTSMLRKLDLNLQYDLEVGGRDVLLSMDIFNVLNTARPVRFNEDGDTGSGAANPNYRLVTAYQSPRAIRLSARFNLF